MHSVDYVRTSIVQCALCTSYIVLNNTQETGMTYGDNFQRNLDRYMKAENISHNSVAVKTGVSQKTVWSVVTGRSVPSLNTTEMVAATVGVDARIMVSKELSPQQVKRSRKIGKMLDQMIELNAEQLDTVGGVLRAFTSTE